MAKLNDVKKDLSKWRIKETDQLSKRVTKASKLASVSLQKRINREVQTPVSFTKNAVGFNFRYDKYGSTNRIFIKDIQANYLGRLIDDTERFGKFVPTGVRGSTNKYGNIPGLKQMRNLEKVDQTINGKKRTVLIKKTASRKNRLIAVYKNNQEREKSLGSWNVISEQIIKDVKRVSGLV